MKTVVILDGDWHIGGKTRDERFGIIKYLYEQGIDQIFFVDKREEFKNYLKSLADNT